MKQTKFSWLLGIVMVVSLVLSGCVGAAEPAEPAEGDGPAPAEEEAEESAELPQIVPIEGPDIILDEAMWPTEFSEAPSLAEMVAAGDLPPVEDRLPEDPMVIKPLGEIGKYGGHLAARFHRPRRRREHDAHQQLVAAPRLGLLRFLRRYPACSPVGTFRMKAASTSSISAKAPSGPTVCRSPPTTSFSGMRTSP